MLLICYLASLIACSINLKGFLCNRGLLRSKERFKLGLCLTARFFAAFLSSRTEESIVGLFKADSGTSWLLKL